MTEIRTEKERSKYNLRMREMSKENGILYFKKLSDNEKYNMKI